VRHPRLLQYYHGINPNTAYQLSDILEIREKGGRGGEIFPAFLVHEDVVHFPETFISFEIGLNGFIGTNFKGMRQ
jgi:hypothetical protein